MPLSAEAAHKLGKELVEAKEANKNPGEIERLVWKHEGSINKRDKQVAHVGSLWEEARGR